ETTPMPPLCTSSGRAAALTSPPFRSMTTRGGAESLKTVNSGRTSARMISFPPSGATVSPVTLLTAAARAPGATAIRAAARIRYLGIRFSLELPGRMRLFPLRNAKRLAFLQRFHVPFLIFRDGDGELHVLWIYAAGG